ncbi:hypothetical protein [Pedobacter alpinus]|uniref:Uncharacterized protein n=1 Tax=Pedobacter alpinus TaxID=1590643 RepID=A0ABW5TWA7_9SPHI
MKKLSILILGMMILGVSGCRKVTEQYFTTPNQTVFYDLNASSWTTNNAGRTYSANLSFFLEDIYRNDFDGILVYVSFGDNVYEPVPQTYDGIAYGYTVNNQRITLEIQNSDGSGTITPPGTMRAKVVFIPSQE